MPDTAELLISFTEDLTLARPQTAQLQLKTPRIDHIFQGPSPGMTAVLEKLAGAGASDNELFALAEANDGEAAFLTYIPLMLQLSTAGVLRYSAHDAGRCLAEFRWIAPGGTFDASRAERGRTYSLSRFAYIHKEAAQLIAECPLGRAQVRLIGPHAITAIGLLAESANAESLAHRIEGLSTEGALALLNLLCNAEAVSPTNNCGSPETGDQTPEAWWQFHDLLFHSRSRLGRHDNPYGGTFIHRGAASPPPLLKQEPEGYQVPLARPDLDRLKLTDATFTSVLERRRSVRRYADRPIRVDQLGEFLYRAARIQFVIPTGPGDMQYSYRPHPGGGAIHELEIYPVIGYCEGLEAGIFHYNPLLHRLTHVSERTPSVERFLEMAWITADQKSRPNVCFAITARFARFQWKYESMVYAAILKNVGALYQTMYLVGTAMGLAPCALGGGDSDLFAQAAGLNYYAETTVGEFMLGSRGD